MEFEAIKEVLQTWLTPEDAEAEVEEEEAEEVITPVKAYVLKAPMAPKENKAEKFDALFDGDDDNDLPF